MKIREATENDAPGIVRVLKASLGEADLPLSEKIWNYKHRDNPFGKSLVLIAEEGGSTIGVRAFMRWEWIIDGKLFKAFRAVDTATHPAHQGKGVFKKLTMAAIESAKSHGAHFVFNTPNDQSRPGYLKMGWEIVNKVNVAIKPIFSGLVKRSSNGLNYGHDLQLSGKELEIICENWNGSLAAKEKLFTPKSADYLQWRYETNQLQKYEIVARGDIYVAAYVKKRGKIKELRVAECLHDGSKESVREISKILDVLSKGFGVQVLTYAPHLIDLGIMGFRGNFGPVLTLRALHLNPEEKNKLLNIGNWGNSIGDLELF